MDSALKSGAFNKPLRKNEPMKTNDELERQDMQIKNTIALNRKGCDARFDRIEEANVDLKTITTTLSLILVGNGIDMRDSVVYKLDHLMLSMEKIINCQDKNKKKSWDILKSIITYTLTFALGLILAKLSGQL